MVSQVVAWFDNTFTYFAAGRDTTATTLAFVIYILSQYPHVMGRLRQEVLAHVGSTRRPTFDDIRDMKYLRAVLNGKSSALIQFKPSPIVQKLSVYFPFYLSISGKACHYRTVVSLDSYIFRESIHPTTLPNPDPNDKPFYVPAGTKYVLLARLEIVDSLASPELHIPSS